MNKIESQINYRYFCPGCTGRACYANKPYEFNQVTCQNCGLLITEYDANNWFVITDAEELAKVNYAR